MTALFYVDEDPDQRESFATKAALSEFFSEIIRPAPNSELDDMVEAVLSSGCSALITDFNLREHDDSINYDGAALASAITDRRESFPCFIVTSYENDALKEAVDVNMIYDRISFDDDNFFKRVQAQIHHHSRTLDTLTERLATLTKRSTSELNEDELIELFTVDRKLEAAIDARSALPEQLRNLPLEETLGELIAETEDLIEKIKAEKG